jgi:hypothetical protein
MAGYIEVDGGVHTPSEERRGVHSSPGLSAGRPGSSPRFSTLTRHRRPPSHPRPYLPDPRVVAVRARSQSGGDLAARTVDTLTLGMSPATSPCGSLRRWRLSSGPRWFRGRSARRGSPSSPWRWSAFSRRWCCSPVPKRSAPASNDTHPAPNGCLGGQLANTSLWIFSARHRSSSRFSQDSLRSRRFS